MKIPLLQYNVDKKSVNESGPTIGSRNRLFRGPKLRKHVFNSTEWKLEDAIARVKSKIRLKIIFILN